jgi:hypothetical protein
VADPIAAEAGWIRLRTLERRLRETKAMVDAGKAASNHDPFFQERFAAHGSLVALVDFFWSMPGWGPELAGPLQNLIAAIQNIEEGRHVDWLRPKPEPGAPPIALEIAALRGRCATVMDFLMKKGGMKEKEAGEYVCRHLGTQAMSALVGKKKPTQRAAWKTVQDWRQKVIGKPDWSYELTGFNAMWKLLDDRGCGSSATAAESEARRFLAAIREAVAELR